MPKPVEYHVDLSICPASFQKLVQIMLQLTSDRAFRQERAVYEKHLKVTGWIHFWRGSLS